MRVVNTQLRTSAKIASATARLGGKTVRVTGKTIKRSMKIPAATVKKVKLMKQKLRHLNKAVVKNKLKKAVAASGKFVVKSAKFTVKSGVKAAGKAADGLADSIDNDTVRFAKQSYNAAKATASGARRTVKTVKKAVKKSQRLVKSVKRNVNRIKRTAKATKKVVKATAKVVKAAAKLVAKAVTKIVSLIVETFPYSLFVIAIIALIVIIVFLVANLFSHTIGQQDRVAGWAIDESDCTEEDVYSNIKELGQRLKTGCENKFAKDLKDEISAFCVSVSDPQRIIEYTVGDTSATLFPAAGSDSTINPIIDSVINDFSRHTATEYSNFMAALVVLTARKNFGNESFALEKFTQTEIEEFIGGLNSNSCSFGSTFFAKTTTKTTGETCPNADCKTKKERGCDCGGKDENGQKYCKGHPYCDNDHEKLTVKFQTVDKYYGKTFSEIYGLNDEDAAYFSDVGEFIRVMLKEMAMQDASGGDSR